MVSPRQALRRAVVLATVGAALICAVPAHATNYAPAGSDRDTITLAAATYTLGIAGIEEDANGKGDLDITAPLDIKGAGNCNTTIDAAGIDRVIDAKKSDNDVAISGLTITGGKAP